MHINHIKGRSIADTGAMAALTGRAPRVVREVCTRDPGGYDVDNCDQQLKDNPDAGHMTAAEAERYLRIPANRIYQWAHKRWLEPVDRDGRSPVYRVEDIKRLDARGDRHRRPTCNNE